MKLSELTWPMRAVAYLFIGLVGSVVAFHAGMQFETSRHCSAPNFDGECDLAGLAGPVWTAAFIPAAALLVLVTELMLLRASRR
ncbi:hypothetical protein ncot_11960 [Nocardioides sp. JQ2195]|uniref:hypothetical protein n=1 Tax=Nocardioides sp. JQ2195 TaxID=2592334 RepID=UPI00143EADB7|nr:hypothetical protein [Nocardioides sp. JQ2195]QIX27235.1 hypothetical protein ncot_11960 [Nocardioides sp. JQ2195]